MQVPACGIFIFRITYVSSYFIPAIVRHFKRHEFLFLVKKKWAGKSVGNYIDSLRTSRYSGFSRHTDAH